MLKFGLKNVRRLRDVAPVEFRSINLLVGRNSSGKSTFLRALPLLRQSLTRKTSSPILWYGDYVDFGSFEGVVTNNNLGDEIGFLFSLDGIELTRPRAALFSSIADTIEANVEVYIKLIQKDVRISRLRVKIPEYEVDFECDINNYGFFHSIKVNGIECTPFYKPNELVLFEDSVFPDVDTYTSIPDPETGLRINATDIHVVNEVAKLIKGDVDRRNSNEKLLAVATQLLRMQSFSAKNILTIAENTKNRSIQKFLYNLYLRPNQGLRRQLSFLYHVNSFPSIATSIFRGLTDIMTSILYIGPVRARSERYYRYQDLAVSEIDPDGKNFPMFLNSLDDTAKRDFSKWVEARFGYGVEVEPTRGHLSINLTSNEKVINIVDSGYGVSQILPVLGQLWWALRKRDFGRSFEIENASILAIEQPELHLHPAHQALLADALVDGQSSSAEDNNSNLKIIVETHSEALINRLGELVALNKILSENIQILIFEPDSESPEITNVRTSYYNRDGTLLDWPYGFFLPDIPK